MVYGKARAKSVVTDLQKTKKDIFALYKEDIDFFSPEKLSKIQLPSQFLQEYSASGLCRFPSSAPFSEWISSNPKLCSVQ